MKTQVMLDKAEALVVKLEKKVADALMAVEYCEKNKLILTAPIMRRKYDRLVLAHDMALALVAEWQSMKAREAKESKTK